MAYGLADEVHEPAARGRLTSRAAGRAPRGDAPPRPVAHAAAPVRARRGGQAARLIRSCDVT